MFKNARKALAALVLSGVIVASSACGIDRSTSAPAAKAGSSLLGTSKFVPSSKILFGIPDGIYTVTVMPGQATSFDIGGTSRLDIPADAICDLATSGYGSSMWDTPCTPSAVPVTITVTSKGALSSSPMLSFLPDMRFAPGKEVQLFMFGKDVTPADAAGWHISYCTVGLLGAKGCVDESVTDTSLQSHVDAANNVVFRRIKHFSDYELTFCETEDCRSGYVAGT
jgi:hypothetical protein